MSHFILHKAIVHLISKLTVLYLLGVWILPVSAINFTWSSTTGGSFHTASNWMPSFLGPPNSAVDSAIFAQGGTFDVIFNIDTTNDRLIMTATEGTVTLDLNGRTYQLAGATGADLIVGESIGDNSGLVITNGTLRVDNDVEIGANHAGVGTLALAGINANLLQSGFGRLTIGGPTGASDVLTIQDDGFYTTGLGTTTINRSGVVILNNGNLDVKGNLLIHGGLFTQTNALSQLGLAVAGTTVIEAGGLLDLQQPMIPANSVTVTGMGSTLRSPEISLSDGSSQLTIAAGGRVEGNLIVGEFDTTALANIDGVGSHLEAGFTKIAAPVNNAIAAKGLLRVRNGATANLGALQIVPHLNSSSAADGELVVDTGATATTDSLDIGNDVSGNAADRAVLTVSGAGSTITNNGITQIGSEVGTAEINVQSNGQFVTGAALTKVNRTGTVRIDGGTLRLRGDLMVEGGKLLLTTGAFQPDPNTDITIQAAPSGIGGFVSLNGSYLTGNGNSLLIRSGSHFVVSNTFSFFGTSSVDMNGGSITAADVGIGSQLTGFGVVQGDVLVGEPGLIVASAGILELGNETSPNGFASAGLLNVGSQRVILHDQNQARLGNAIVSGGELVADNGILIEQGLTLSGSGLVDANVQNSGAIDVPAGGALTFRGDLIQDRTLTIAETGSLTVDGRYAGKFGFDGGGTMVVLGELNPGASPGSQTASLNMDGDLILETNSMTRAILRGTAIGDFDQLVVSGDLRIRGGLSIGAVGQNQPFHGDEYLIAEVGGALIGEFVGLAEGSLAVQIDSTKLFITYQAGDGNDIALQAISAGDFNLDGSLNCADVDTLVAEIVAGGNAAAFDLNGDDLVNTVDLGVWLSEAGRVHLPSGNRYLAGDGNLDGVVDGQDFIIWNNHKFTSVAAWCSGDFNADGVVDGQDFVVWNGNKFTSSDSISAVPEPRMCVLLMCGVAGLWLRSSASANRLTSAESDNLCRRG